MLIRVAKATLLFLLAQLSFAAEQFDIPANYVKHDYRIPMRDGVHLFTSVYSPKKVGTAYPILMTRTPYSVAPYGADAYPRRLGPSINFPRDGFIFVYQDVRGRFQSEGKWEEMRPEKDKTSGPSDIDESTDTFDSIDWLVKNVPENNGKVGLIGVSYPGFYTSTGLINSHPALVAASPQAPVSDLYMGDDAYHNGAFFLLANFDFYTGFSPQENPVLPGGEKPFAYSTEDGYRFFLQMGALMNSNELYFKYKNPYWTAMLQHPNYDEFWKARNVLPHLRDVRPAVLVVGGWFDAEDLSGTLQTFRAIQQQSPQTTDRLVMGPWIHGGWWRPSFDKLGDVSFGSNTSQFFQDEIELPFFQHYLKGGPDPNLPKAYVFETGKNEWQKKSAWPPANATSRRLYLRADRKLSLEAPTDASGFDQYVSDPQSPVPFLNKPTHTMSVEYMDADQRFAESRPDVLTYQTEPLQEEFTIAGPISPSLSVSTTGTDSDFVVKLIDVSPTGYEQLVRGEPFRGKFRHSFEHPEPFVPNEVDQIHFSMPDVYHCFQKGHRVMVQVQSSWFPLVDRNPQTFTNIPAAKVLDFVKATERVSRTATSPSFVEVNVERQ